MTAQELIKAALRGLGVVGRGMTPSNDLIANGLEALKIMIRSWSVGDCYYVSVETFSLDGSASYTIGSGADFDTTRPVKIIGGYTTSGGIDRPFSVIAAENYSELSDKTTQTGDVVYVWYNPTEGSSSHGTVYVYPPNTGTITLNNLVGLAEPSNISSNVLLPNEYDMAIKFGLMVHLAPEHGREATQTILSLYQDGMDSIEAYHASLRLAPAKLDIPTPLSRRGLYRVA